MEFVCLTGYRDCILVFLRCPRFPATGCTVCIPLFPVVSHIIRVYLKGCRSAPGVTLRGLDLYQYISARTQRLIQFNISNRDFLHLSVLDYLPDGGISPENAGLISILIFLPD